MNNRPVEQALGILVPTHAADLPQELLSLSLSLVAQSRSLSSSLKPEEEIARPYACAEIACRRYVKRRLLAIHFYLMELLLTSIDELQINSLSRSPSVTRPPAMPAARIQEALYMVGQVSLGQFDRVETLSKRTCCWFAISS